MGPREVPAVRLGVAVDDVVMAVRLRVEPRQVVEHGGLVAVGVGAHEVGAAVVERPPGRGRSGRSRRRSVSSRSARKLNAERYGNGNGREPRPEPARPRDGLRGAGRSADGGSPPWAYRATRSVSVVAADLPRRRAPPRCRPARGTGRPARRARSGRRRSRRGRARAGRGPSAGATRRPSKSTNRPAPERQRVRVARPRGRRPPPAPGSSSRPGGVSQSSSGRAEAGSRAGSCS